MAIGLPHHELKECCTQLKDGSLIVHSFEFVILETIWGLFEALVLV